MRIETLLRMAAALLRQSDIEQPMREARFLLAHASGISFSTIMSWPETELDGAQVARFEALLARRRAHEPLSRILGSREFWSLDFLLGPDTLDPRPDSETLVEAVLAQIDDRSRPLRLVDFGTGTGCLLLALLSELKNAWGLGVDRAEGAARVAAENARRLNLNHRASFVVGDWDTSLGGPFDIVISNPPYIASADLPTLMPEVRLHDPPLALDGGPDGLAPYRILAPAARRLLQSGGIAAFECGQGQAQDIAAILTRQNLPSIEIKRDLGNIERVIVAQAP
ncbi:MAG TPA: peptide chain release factor N(5)-glutamine methyltransferase [Stellaceae bacterium]|jgi:release factor glutamine methyltransferase|nr:peptide chain release factor N(5)-glutamine methyltransferase [Stellaceae bacterium]